MPNSCTLFQEAKQREKALQDQVRSLQDRAASDSEEVSSLTASLATFHPTKHSMVGVEAGCESPKPQSQVKQSSRSLNLNLKQKL